MREHIAHFKKNLYFLLFGLFFLLLLRVADREVFFVLIYYADMKLWLGDPFWGYGVVMMIYAVVFLAALVVLKGIDTYAQEGWNHPRNYLRFVAVLGIFYLILRYLSAETLRNEIDDYDGFWERARVADLQEQKEIARLLEGDCRITLGEANAPLLGRVQENTASENVIDMGMCEADGGAKRKLIDLLSEKYVAVYR